MQSLCLPACLTQERYRRDKKEVRKKIRRQHLLFHHIVKINEPSFQHMSGEAEKSDY